jgi:circadian clock protein KaiC
MPKTPRPSLEKASTGIPGFDTLTGGGSPRGRTTLLVGGPGCGKTIFALQSLVEGARRFQEPGIFVAFEERAKQILSNVACFGWDLPALQRKRLFFLDARLASDTIKGGAFDLDALLAGLSAKAHEMKARRIVFDGIDILLSQLDDPAAERREIRRLYEWLTESGLTGMVTAKTDGPEPSLSSSYGALQYLADCVVELDHRLANGIAIRHMRVLKYRGSATSSNEFPIHLSEKGMEVGVFLDDNLEHPVSTKKVTSGIERLDAMLGGGYFRGTCVLVSGAPGTAKSTLAATFIDAACRSGERALYVSFDESGAQIVRNFHSVGLRLEKHIRAGLLKMHSVRASSRSTEEHLLRIRTILQEHRARFLVVDPLSALPGATGASEAFGSVERLINLAKREGVTLLATSLLDGSDALRESTIIGASTIADTWIHLSYVIQSGERNRALTIIKSRGMGHSNQVRELLLSSRGITLADVYTARGEVLMGTLREEKEERDRVDRLYERREAEGRVRDVEASISETSGRLSAVKAELQGKVLELASARAQRSTDVATASGRLIERRLLRHADETPALRGHLRSGHPRRG